MSDSSRNVARRRLMLAVACATALCGERTQASQPPRCNEGLVPIAVEVDGTPSDEALQVLRRTAIELGYPRGVASSGARIEYFKLSYVTVGGESRNVDFQASP